MSELYKDYDIEISEYEDEEYIDPDIESYEKQIAYEEQIRDLERQVRGLEYMLRRAENRNCVLSSNLDTVKSMFEELAFEHNKIDSSYYLPSSWEEFWYDEL